MNETIARLKQQRDDAITDASKLAEAIQDLYNLIGEVKEVKHAYLSVERVLGRYV